MKASVNCIPKILKGDYRFSYRYDCDSIIGRIYKVDDYNNGHDVFSMQADLHGDLYRLGFFLKKDYASSVLFRSGCLANGPCTYLLICKKNGKILKKYRGY